MKIRTVLSVDLTDPQYPIPNPFRYVGLTFRGERRVMSLGVRLKFCKGEHL